MPSFKYSPEWIYACLLSYSEDTKTGGRWVQGWPGIQSEFKTTLDNLVRPLGKDKESQGGTRL